MRESAQRAVALCRGRTRAELDTDEMLGLAVTRLLEIIGEAANRISAAEQARHPTIQWSDILGLRHRLIHGYDSVDYDIVWQIVIEDLPLLVSELDAII
jgi:uncharacterized protein with HEPN domain